MAPASPVTASASSTRWHQGQGLPTYLHAWEERGRQPAGQSTRRAERRAREAGWSRCARCLVHIHRTHSSPVSHRWYCPAACRPSLTGGTALLPEGTLGCRAGRQRHRQAVGSCRLCSAWGGCEGRAAVVCWRGRSGDLRHVEPASMRLTRTGLQPCRRVGAQAARPPGAHAVAHLRSQLRHQCLAGEE